MPEEYGGAGISTFKYYAIEAEETARAGVSFGGSGVHAGLCLPYLLKLGTPEQLAAWLPGFVSGETMFAIAMTEPGTGSDLAGMRTTARKSADGSHYVLNGAKTFITGGVHADRVIVCARTSPSLPDDRRFGISLLVVDALSPGYSVGRKLDKIGLRVSDTAELTFSDVIVPAGDLLGEEDKGFSYLGQNLPQERLSIAYGAYAQAAAAVRFAMEYTKQRTVFGKEVASFQNTKFELAACQAKVDAAQAVADRALEALDAGELTPAEAASAKLFCTESRLGGHRPVPAAARRLRLHQRVPDRAAVRRQPGQQDLRRHLRGHEDDHREEHGTVTGWPCSPGRPIGTAACCLLRSGGSTRR